MAESTVATPSAAYEEMVQHWNVIEAVRGGTPTMRDAKTICPKSRWKTTRPTSGGAQRPRLPPGILDW